MYVPRHFSMSDDEVRTLLASVDVVDLVTPHADGLQASFLPVLHDPEPGPYGRLVAHVQRNNPQATSPVTGPGLVIVHGPDHYVSPSGLPSTAEHGRVVPTWDYVTVHLQGEVRFHDDPAWTRAAVTRLTERHEPADGWSVDDPPGDHVERMLRAVVGVEFMITGWQGKAKMAQNKTPADVEALVARRRELGDRAGADHLEQVSLPAARARAALLEDVRGRH
ncbi:FMN-binding negative transcriptional regulator [Raineyella antarctica]|nr:FMN-binding negative transcriptional regulator [Raineyella antarctica]